MRLKHDTFIRVTDPVRIRLHICFEFQSGICGTGRVRVGTSKMLQMPDDVRNEHRTRADERNEWETCIICCHGRGLGSGSVRTGLFRTVAAEISVGWGESETREGKYKAPSSEVMV